ncbi:MAG TPA: TonB-dependent receptor [Gemmatimonadaceae bacterium]|nr:TonB-dependent receptor [Gemmatimonadaceae bacterium]
MTTGGITGNVSDENGQPVEGAQVQLRNTQTGYNVGTVTRATGQYTIQGVLPNPNYEIMVRRIGFAPLRRQGLTIALGQIRREDFRLTREATTLTAVDVVATADAVINASKTGASTTISDSALTRLPTLNRNFSDFVSLVPQVATTTGYLSGGGVNLRQNSIQIDGAQSGDLFGIGTTGQPGASANAKSIPLDAVKEYQVLLSPFDVRQGSFGGLLINAVTKSGTNEFHGGGFFYTRNQSLTRKQPYLQDYKQSQFGGSLGGPILKDRLFFFATGEFQQRRLPATGPFIGSQDAPLAQSSIDQLNQILSTKYNFTEGGTGEQVQRDNPLRNIFGRVDAYLPLNTRLVLRHNYAYADNITFSRGAATSATPEFKLTSNSYKFSSETNSSVAEFITNLSNGLYNELLINNSTTNDFRTVPVKFPQLTIRGVPRSDGAAGSVNLVVGTDGPSQGNSLDQHTVEITDNFTIPIGSHAITLGTKNVFYSAVNLFASNAYGVWEFANLDALNNGVANRYAIATPAPTDPNQGLARIKARSNSFYVQDAWAVTPQLSVTAGVRWDKPTFKNFPPLNQTVLTEYGRATNVLPQNAQISPRLGFNWDVTGDQVNQVRGGIGSFTGPPPFVYLSNAFGNSGLSGFTTLTCDGNTAGTTSRAVPAFNQQNIATPPTACAPATVAGVTKPGLTGALGARINTIDPDFKFPKYLKASLGFDHRFSSGLLEGVTGTVEGLYTRSQQNVFYQNLALVGPQGTDSRGRVIYGIFGTGNPTSSAATPTTKGSRTEVLDATNSSGDYTWSTTFQLHKSFTTNYEGSVAYTYQQARDVTSTTSSTANSNYRYQRSTSGRLDDRSVSRSKYDQPHRIVATGTYRFPTLTDVSFIYTGNSGAPIDFVYGTTGGTTGDANADGQTQNDLMYVPRSATDPTEILFTGYSGTAAQQAAAAAQAQAFETFISNTPCLNSQRGRIMERNSCRNPWINQVDVSLAQSLRALRYQNLQVRLDIINFGNLLNKNWGKTSYSDQNATCGQICSATVALTQTGNKLPGTLTASQEVIGVYTFDQKYKLFTSDFAGSNYQMQLSLRYSF